MNKFPFFALLTIVLWLLPYKISAQSYENLVEQSCDLLEQDSLEAAQRVITQALRLEPGNATNGMLLCNLGTIQRRLGDLEGASQSYTIALGFMPDNPTILLSRAKLFAATGRYTEALDDYNTLVINHPNDEDFLYQRAMCLLMNKDTLGARLDLEKINELNPQSAQARLGMANVYKAQRFFREAIELYDALVKRNPKSARLYRDRAEAHYLDNHTNTALADINRSIELDPRDPYAYLLRAQIRYVKNDKEFARRDINQALTLGLDRAEASELLEKLDKK